MIGGIDTEIPTRAGEFSMQAAVGAMIQCWPLATFENGLTGERYDTYWQIPFSGELEEVFVYRDSGAADAWDAEGAVPTVYNTMVHLIADEGTITVVLDVKDAVAEMILEAIASALSDDVFCPFAELEAA